MRWGCARMDIPHLIQRMCLHIEILNVVSNPLLRFRPHLGVAKFPSRSFTLTLSILGKPILANKFFISTSESLNRFSIMMLKYVCNYFKNPPLSPTTLLFINICSLRSDADFFSHLIFEILRGFSMKSVKHISLF